MVDDHAVTVNPEERQEVARSLATRRDDLDKERKRMEDRGLRTDAVDEVLTIHRGDGATNGLVSKFAPQDNCDIFDEPEPVGDISVTGGKSGKRVLSDGGDQAQLSADLFTGKLKADAVSGSKVVDSEGTVFEAGVLVVVTYTKKGTLCQMDGCERLQEDGVCSQDNCPQKPVESHIPCAGTTEGEAALAAKDPAPTEGEVGAKVMESRKALAIQAVNDATEMPVADRRHVIQYILEEAGLSYLSEVTSWKAGEKFPTPPKGWKPKGKDEGTPEDYTGLKFTQASKIFVQEKNVPRSYLDGQGTGRGGTLTKGDVEDAISRWISAEAQNE